MWRLAYLFQPKDTSPGAVDPACRTAACRMQAAKTLLWISLAILTGLAIGQLG